MVKGNFSLLIRKNVFNIKIYSSSLMDKTNLDFCPASIESRLQKMMEPKPRQILAIILTVFIQFLIICCWTSYKYFILKSCTFIIHCCSFFLVRLIHSLTSTQVTDIFRFATSLLWKCLEFKPLTFSLLFFVQPMDT